VHQGEFLQRYRHRFTNDEVAEIEAAWHSRFVKGGQTPHRNGRIWFCLSRSLVRSEGTEPFFQYFGGESVFMPLKRHEAISRKLKGIGNPVVVEVSIAGEDERNHLTMAKEVLSVFHRSLRPDAHPWSAETIHQAVPASDVLAVTPVAAFES
jgi:hypothetical protein